MINILHGWQSRVGRFITVSGLSVPKHSISTVFQTNIGKRSSHTNAGSEVKIVKRLVAREQIPKNIGFLMEIGQRHMISTCLFTVVDLGCIDAIGNDKLTTEEVVSRLTSENKGVQVELLERLLRIASQDGLLNEDENSNGEAVFSLTDAGALLQTSAPQPCFQPMIFH